VTLRTTLRQQADAVARAAANHRGHCENLRDLVARGKRPLHEMEFAFSYVRALEDAAVTMRELADQAETDAA
jgi:hypothetical protein